MLDESTGAPSSVPSLGVTVTFHDSPLEVRDDGTVIWSFLEDSRIPSLYHLINVPDSESPSESWKVYVSVSVSVVTGFAGDSRTLVAVGGLFGAGPDSGTVIVVVPHASPLFPFAPLAVIPARLN